MQASCQPHGWPDARLTPDAGRPPPVSWTRGGRCGGPLSAEPDSRSVPADVAGVDVTSLEEAHGALAHVCELVGHDGVEASLVEGERSEARRGGKEWVSTCRYRWWPET